MNKLMAIRKVRPAQLNTMPFFIKTKLNLLDIGIAQDVKLMLGKKFWKCYEC